MTVELATSRVNGNHGLVHQVRVADVVIDVHVELLKTGQWYVRIARQGFGEMGATAGTPSEAFMMTSIELVDPTWRSQAPGLPWADIHNELQTQGAFKEEDSITLTAAEAKALDIPLKSKRLPTVAEAEHGLRAWHVIRSMYGIADDAPWRVVSIGKVEDFYRDVTIHIRFGLG